MSRQAGELPAAGAGWVMDGSFRGGKHRELGPEGPALNLRFRQFLASGPCNGQPVGSARNAVSSFRLPVKTLYYARIQNNTFISCSICRKKGGDRCASRSEERRVGKECVSTCK